MGHRWHATVYYRAPGGGDGVDVEYDIEELEELQDIIERGPDWNAVLGIVVTLARKTNEEMTI